MAPTPVRHPLRDTHDQARRRAIAAHPATRAQRPLVAGGPPPVAAHGPATSAATASRPGAVDRFRLDEQTGSMTTEYGLVVVVGATIVSLVIKWASGGAVFELLDGVLQAAKGLAGF